MLAPSPILAISAANCPTAVAAGSAPSSTEKPLNASIIPAVALIPLAYAFCANSLAGGVSSSPCRYVAPSFKAFKSQSAASPAHDPESSFKLSVKLLLFTSSVNCSGSYAGESGLPMSSNVGAELGVLGLPELGGLFGPASPASIRGSSYCLLPSSSSV